MDKLLFFIINNLLVLLSSIIAFRSFKNRSQELLVLGIADLFQKHLGWPAGMGLLSLTGYLGSGV